MATTPVTTSAPPSYQANSQHRNTAFSTQKSQWTILANEEIATFNWAHQCVWQCSKRHYWGLHLAVKKPLELGKSPEQESCYIAKFVNDQNVWHGYPVALGCSPFDKPPIGILSIWHNQGFINKATRRKITQGKRCTL
jgi:hypothetical protein